MIENATLKNASSLIFTIKNIEYQNKNVLVDTYTCLITKI